MPHNEPGVGWAWLDGRSDVPRPRPDLCRRAARCFASADGAVVLDHLRRSFLDRRLPPAASDAELRHLEGQRSIVAHLIALMARGRDDGSTGEAIGSTEERS